MKKKNLIMMLVVGVMIGTMLTGCGKEKAAPDFDAEVAADMVQDTEQDSGELADDYGTSAVGYPIIPLKDINPEDYPEGYFHTYESEYGNVTCFDQPGSPDSITVGGITIDLHPLYGATNTDSIVDILVDISHVMKFCYASTGGTSALKEYEGQKDIPRDAFAEVVNDTSDISGVYDIWEFQFRDEYHDEINVRVDYDWKNNNEFIASGIFFGQLYRFSDTSDEVMDSRIYFNYDDLELSVLYWSDGTPSVSTQITSSGKSIF